MNAEPTQPPTQELQDFLNLINQRVSQITDEYIETRLRRALKQRQFQCCRCGKYNSDAFTFGYGKGHTVCLHHIPWWVRFRMRLWPVD